MVSLTLSPQPLCHWLCPLCASSSLPPGQLTALGTFSGLKHSHLTRAYRLETCHLGTVHPNPHLSQMPLSSHIYRHKAELSSHPHTHTPLPPLHWEGAAHLFAPPAGTPTLAQIHPAPRSQHLASGMGKDSSRGQPFVGSPLNKLDSLGRVEGCEV